MYVCPGGVMRWYQSAQEYLKEIRCASSRLDVNDCGSRMDYEPGWMLLHRAFLPESVTAADRQPPRSVSFVVGK